jgi:hypothetical protein
MSLTEENIINIIHIESIAESNDDSIPCDMKMRLIDDSDIKNIAKRILELPLTATVHSEQHKSKMKSKALHRASTELGFGDFLEGLGQSGGVARFEIIERAMEYYAESLT